MPDLALWGGIAALALLAVAEAHDNTHGRNALAVGTIWTEVLLGGPEQTSLHADRMLFLCWPPPRDPMAYETIEAYRRASGRRMAYVGEMFPVCGDESFEATLMGLWRPVAGVDIPGLWQLP